jgi:hypothetical protein
MEKTEIQIRKAKRMTATIEKSPHRAIDKIIDVEIR